MNKFSNLNRSGVYGGPNPQEMDFVDLNEGMDMEYGDAIEYYDEEE